MMTLLIVLGTLTLVGAAIAFWARPVPTPIPSSVVEWYRKAKRGPLWKTLWRAFLIVVLFTIAGATVASGGVLLPFVVATFISILLSERLQELAYDLWYLDFHEVNT